MKAFLVVHAPGRDEPLAIPMTVTGVKGPRTVQFGPVDIAAGQTVMGVRIEGVLRAEYFRADGTYNLEMDGLDVDQFEPDPEIKRLRNAVLDDDGALVGWRDEPDARPFSGNLTVRELLARRGE